MLLVNYPMVVMDIKLFYEREYKEFCYGDNILIGLNQLLEHLANLVRATALRARILGNFVAGQPHFHFYYVK